MQLVLTPELAVIKFIVQICHLSIIAILTIFSTKRMKTQVSQSSFKLLFWSFLWFKGIACRLRWFKYRFQLQAETSWLLTHLKGATRMNIFTSNSKNTPDKQIFNRIFIFYTITQFFQITELILDGFLLIQHYVLVVQTC